MTFHWRRRRIILASRRKKASAEVLIQATITVVGDKTAEGQLIVGVTDVWLEIMLEIDRDPEFLFQFVKHPRKFEEFIAATYSKSGEWQVELTPRSGDGGRDVIVAKPGFGAIRFLEQCKAYSHGHLVTHDDVRSMMGVLSRDLNASKGLITTTSDFQPGIYTSEEFQALVPNRLELKNGDQLRQWLLQVNEGQR